MFTLIGLTGTARSGKDTAADVLEDMFDFDRYALAGPLKQGVKVMLGLTDEHIHGALKETIMPEYGFSPRQAMQTLGTEWGRSLSPDLWLRVAQREIEHAKCYSTFVKGMVITDVRFDNEAEWLRKQGGKLVKIVRPDAEQVVAHSSEQGVSVTPDLIIYNNGTLEEYTALIAKEVSRLLAKGGK